MLRRPLRGALLAALLCVAAPGLACAQDTDLRMPLEQLKKRMAVGGVVVVDVRGDGAYAGGHIPGAISIPLEQIEARAGELRKANAFVTYCA